MNVTFQTRAFTGEIASLPLDWSVASYRNAAVGGPRSAILTARGAENDLWELVERLRCPVQIYGDRGEPVWWGYVAEVSLEIGKVQAVVNLDSMSNRVAVAYSYLPAGSTIAGERRTTGWAQNNDSVADYGIKELLYSTPGSSDSHAEACRDALLAQKSKPMPGITFNGMGSTAGIATVYCKGWWDTLEWRYASVPVELAVQYATIGAREESIGRTSGNSRIAQAFDVGTAAINAAAVEIYVRKVGTPSDNLTVAIYTNPDDVDPETSVISATLAGEGIGTDYAWVRVIFSSAETLTANTSYFLQVSRGGSGDDDNYYQIKLDGNQGYAAGPCVTYDGDWSETDADMPFRIFADAIIPTGQQIKSLATAYGQFFNRVALEVDSGISTESYRDGDGSALYEIQELMRMGNSAGKRILSTVDANRWVRIFAEPDAAQGNTYYLNRGGELFDAFDTPIDKQTAPAGVWARLKDVIPGSVDTSKLADPTLSFIEECEYVPATDTLTMLPRGLDDPWLVGRAKDG